MNTEEVKRGEKIGTWQTHLIRTSTERVQKALKRAVSHPEICLEHARAEIAVDKEVGNTVSRTRKRALIFKKYLEDRSIFIREGELVVGSINSKQRGSTIVGDLYANFIAAELDDPVKDYEIRENEKHHITDEERKELREVIIPYFKGKTMADLIYSTDDEEIREYGFAATSSCRELPIFADLMTYQDAGHMLANYEKVLCIGLKGIREEAVRYKERMEQRFVHFEKKEKIDFYESVIICLDAAMAHAKRYSQLALGMAEKETDEKRKQELLEIARITAKVPAEPAESWAEALQSVWFIQMFILCEQINYADSFGRFDQYMYPFYKKSVEDDKTMTRDEALEWLEMFWIKTAEWTALYDNDTANYQMGFSINQNLMIGGEKNDGSDACNEVTMLCLEAEEQAGLGEPDLSFRISEKTPRKYLRKAAEVVRLGKGKPKFYGDKRAMKMIKKAYPYISDEELHDYAVCGCIELALPHMSMQHSYCGVCNVASILAITLNDGKCPRCGKQMGPKTGEARDFKSMEDLKAAYEKQMYFWMEKLCKAVSAQLIAQAKWTPSPFSSSLLEGPLEKGKDLIHGGAWDTSYGLMIGGSINAGNALAVIDRLIFTEKKVTWDEMMTALKDDWKGHEPLRQMCINLVPKFGNDIDFVDNYVAYVQDIWYDTIDWANTQRDFFPSYGGTFKGTSIMANTGVSLGVNTEALPDGFLAGTPLSDAMSPVQSTDVNGTTAVLKSTSKLPHDRYAMGALLNQRLTPEMLRSEEDLDAFVDYLQTANDLGVFHVQFNVIDGELMRDAQEHPENYRDLLVRVASYSAFFNDLDHKTQDDIISRTEHENW